MDVLLVLVLVVGALAMFDLLALSLGTDSRDSIGDDWSRPLGTL